MAQGWGYEVQIIYNIAHIQIHVNKLSYIISNYGCIYIEHDNIANSFIEHYANLWSSCSVCFVNDILALMPNDLNTLTTFDKQYLVRLMTIGEIYCILKSIPKGKSQVLVSLRQNFIFSIGILQGKICLEPQTIFFSFQKCFLTYFLEGNIHCIKLKKTPQIESLISSQYPSTIQL